MNWSRSWSKVCDYDRIIPNPSRSASGPWCWGSADVAFRTPLAPYDKSMFLGSGGSMVAWLKLKGIDGRAPPGVEPVA
ncbi:hypothetical protein YC2023_066039 [Brassica napus]